MQYEIAFPDKTSDQSRGGHRMSVVTISDHAKVRTLTLNRPEALNAFNEALCDGLTVPCSDAAADPDVSVLLITERARLQRRCRPERIHSQGNRIPTPSPPVSTDSTDLSTRSSTFPNH